MNPALVALAAVTIGGAVLAVAARDVRAVALGILVVLLGGPLVADPWPDPLSILVRTAATLLAARLVSIGLRGATATAGTRIGWPAEALVAGAAAVAGFGSHGLGAAGLGPAEAQAVGFALVALAVAPLAAGRDALRIAIGAVLLLVGGVAIRTALDAPPTQAEALIDALLTIALGGAIAVLATAGRRAGGLSFTDGRQPAARAATSPAGPGGATRRVPRLADAHRVAPASPPSQPGDERP